MYVAMQPPLSFGKISGRAVRPHRPGKFRMLPGEREHKPYSIRRVPDPTFRTL